MWLSLVVPVAMVVTLSQNFGPSSVSTWEAVFASANWGALLGMPVAAAAVALSVRAPSRWMSGNRASVNRTLATRTLVDVAPVLIAIAGGYLLSLAIVLLRATPSAPPTLRSFGPVGVFASIVLVAAFIGFVAGRLLPAPVAVVAAALLQYVMISMPLVSDQLTHLRFVLGYTLPLVLQNVDQQIPGRLIWMPMMLGAVVLVALLLASVRKQWLAAAWVAVATVAALILTTPLTDTLSAPGYEARPASDLHCKRQHGVDVCLWPEFGGARYDGVPLVTSLAAYMTRLTAHGVDAGSMITTSSRQAEERSAVFLSAGPRHLIGAELPISVASGVRERVSCPSAENGEFAAQGDRARDALAIALGADPDALAQRSDQNETWASGQDLISGLGMSTADDGFAVFVQWQAKAATACGRSEG